MDLASDFPEPQTRVKRLADRVLLQRLDLRHLHPAAAEKFQRVAQQRSAHALPLTDGVHRQVGNPADRAIAVEPRRDVPDHAAGRVDRNKDAVRLRLAVGRDGRRFAASPVAAAEPAEQPLHVAVDRDGAEGVLGDVEEARKVLWLVGPDGVTVGHYCVVPIL